MSTKNRELGELLGLIVHDLRNPTAAISANISFVREAVPHDDADVVEAVADLELAVGELMVGLEQVAWIARWLADQAPADSLAPGDVTTHVRTAIERAGGAIPVEVGPGPTRASRCGPALARLIGLLLANGALHAPGTSRIVVHGGEERVTIEVIDRGRAIAPALRKLAFDPEGQTALKGRGDGRYGRVAGLLCARAIADALGARIEADGEDGNAIFRVTLPAT